MMVAALGVVGYSITTVVDMACDTTLACWTKFLQTWPAGYALLAARLLNEFLAALLLETEWIRLGWDLEELSKV